MNRPTIGMLVATAFVGFSQQAVAQSVSGPSQFVTFSIDWHSASVGVPPWNITSGDILYPLNPSVYPTNGPVPTPGGAMSHQSWLGLMPGCVGIPGGVPCPVEVDAFSFGSDFRLIQTTGLQASWLHHSVDPFATGVLPTTTRPNVGLEAVAMDAAGDLFTNVSLLPAGPLSPGVPIEHRLNLDGDGLYSASGYTEAGLGLLEPCPPVIGVSAYSGDNIDAAGIQTNFVPPSHYYFSLEGSLLDPLTGIAATGSAASHGFVGGDVLKTFGSPITVYAAADLLGLDRVPGSQGDDLDALLVLDNGDQVFQPSQTPMDWVGGTTDAVLFSVRRGSPVIGQPDSIFGIPISEGDILTTPLAGGLSVYPGIYYAAELLELATVRSGTARGNFNDDLNALAIAVGEYQDCNGSGGEDVLEIAADPSIDLDGNGTPDVCQFQIQCTALDNSTGLPTRMLPFFGSGSGSGVHLEATQGPPGQFGYFLVGTAGGGPTSVGQGLLCLAIQSPNVIVRYNVSGSPMNSIGVFDSQGVLQNLVGTSAVGSGFDVPDINPATGLSFQQSESTHFQMWHRDAGGQSNLSDSIRVSF